MPRRSATDVTRRRQALIRLLASSDEGFTPAVLMRRMPGRVARRTLHEDLAFLASAFPDQLVRPSKRAQGYRWRGALPVLCERPLAWLSESEALALVAARGLLCPGDRPGPAGWTGRSAGLSGHLHRLLARCGAESHAQHYGRHLISVSRFGAEPIDPEHLETCLQAAATGQAIAFDYTNLHGVAARRVVLPQRLVLIRSEWYCVAWRHALGMYRLSRMSAVAITSEPVPGAPSSIPSQDIDDLLERSFFATGSLDPGRIRRVVLAVSPGAWPFIRGRTWGQRQRIDESPKDLPEGGRRLSFSTTGIEEVRHWVLGMGQGVRAEQPQELQRWLRNESRQLYRLNNRLTVGCSDHEI